MGSPLNYFLIVGLRGDQPPVQRLQPFREKLFSHQLSHDGFSNHTLSEPVDDPFEWVHVLIPWVDAEIFSKSGPELGYHVFEH